MPLTKLSTNNLMDKLNINQWSEDDRPREKLSRIGADKLSSAELLAILIGSGSSDENAVDLMKKVLRNCGNSLKTLGRMSIDSLTEYKGIGEAKAITILAACELGKRRQQEEVGERPDLSDASKIYEYLLPRMQDLDREQGIILLLDNHFRPKDEPIVISQGGLTETSIDVRMIIRHALLANATVVVLAHNHPSGNTHPSHADDTITNQVNEACRLMRIHLADHVIITDGNYYSYRENGKM